MDEHPMIAGMIRLTPEAKGLVWQDWGDLYTLYQPSSTETHVFNEITAWVLRCLDDCPSTLVEIAARIVEKMDVHPDDLKIGDLAFVAGRLEELGLIELSAQISEGR